MTTQIKLNDFLNGINIFNEIKLIEDYPFLEKSPIMDSILKSNYGQRIVFDAFTETDKSELAEMINLLHSEDWKRLILVESMELNIGAGFSKTITETIDETENKTNTLENVNKVSAFDSEELVINDGNNSNGGEDLTGNKSRTLKEENINLQNAYSNLSLLQNRNIMNIVIKDVVDFLTLSIY